MTSAMQKGRVLLAKNAEKLSQLESSLLEEVSTGITAAAACPAALPPCPELSAPSMGWSLPSRQNGEVVK